MYYFSVGRGGSCEMRDGSLWGGRSYRQADQISAKDEANAFDNGRILIKAALAPTRQQSRIDQWRAPHNVVDGSNCADDPLG
jgi:hypothetical protein